MPMQFWAMGLAAWQQSAFGRMRFTYLTGKCWAERRFAVVRETLFKLSFIFPYLFRMVKYRAVRKSGP